jgi:hypothetical protein
LASGAAGSTIDRVSLERVFGGTFAALGANWPVIAATSLALSAIPGAAWGFQYSRIFGWHDHLPFDDARGILILLVTGVLALGVSTLAQGALVQIAAAHREGRRAEFGEALEVGLRALLPMIGRTVLATLATGLAALALLAPAVLLYVVWAVSAPALVIERLGATDALERSQALTRGARWVVLAFQLLLFLMSWGLSLLQGAIAGNAYGQSDSIPALVAGAAVAAFVTAFSAVARTMLYFELRDWKEGPPTDRLAEIFR